MVHGYRHVPARQCHQGNGRGDWLDAAFDWLRTDLHYDANTIAIVKDEVEAAAIACSLRLGDLSVQIRFVQQL
jgi:hypothetical protein